MSMNDTIKLKLKKRVYKHWEKPPLKNTSNKDPTNSNLCFTLFTPLKPH